MDARKSNVTAKVFIDFILLSTFTSCIALFYDYFTPFERGYFCDDEEIMYPYKKYTISNGVLWSTGILLPTLLMITTESLRYWYNMDISKDMQKDIKFCRWKVPHLLQKLYPLEGIFVFGIIMTEIVANYIKVLVGRLRPSFLDQCKPDFNCSEVSNPHYFVSTYTCTNPDLKELKQLKDLRLSFPSGHTAVITYAMVFAVLYLQRRMRFTKSFLLKPLVQLLLLMLATYIAITRLQDNQHHWNDIFAGFILGFTICLIMIFTQTDLYKGGQILGAESQKT